MKIYRVKHKTKDETRYFLEEKDTLDFLRKDTGNWDAFCEEAVLDFLVGGDDYEMRWGNGLELDFIYFVEMLKPDSLKLALSLFLKEHPQILTFDDILRLQGIYDNSLTLPRGGTLVGYWSKEKLEIFQKEIEKRSGEWFENQGNHFYFGYQALYATHFDGYLPLLTVEQGRQSGSVDIFPLRNGSVEIGGTEHLLGNGILTTNAEQFSELTLALLSIGAEVSASSFECRLPPLKNQKAVRWKIMLDDTHGKEKLEEKAERVVKALYEVAQVIKAFSEKYPDRYPEDEEEGE